MINNFIVEEKCPYCAYFVWLPVGLTNPDKLVVCNDCTYAFPILHTATNYKLLKKYYLM